MLSVVPEDCQVFLLLIPHCSQVSETYRSRMQTIGAEFEEGEAIFTKEYPFYTALKQGIHRQKAIRFINTLPVLQEAEQERPVYYGNDPHLNSEGQRTIGDYLVKILKK